MDRERLESYRKRMETERKKEGFTSIFPKTPKNLKPTIMLGYRKKVDNWERKFEYFKNNILKY